MPYYPNPDPGSHVTTPWPGLTGTVDYESDLICQSVVIIDDSGWAWEISLECKGEAEEEDV